MKSCAGRELARPLLQARETRIRTPEDNLLYPEWRNQTQSQLGTTCATSGEGGHSRIQWSGNKSLLPFFWSVPETTAIVFLRSWELMNGSRELAATLSTVLPCVQMISSLICGRWREAGRKRPTEELLLNIFLFPPATPECRSEADAATLELWNSRPGTVASAESLKTQLLKQQPLF